MVTQSPVHSKARFILLALLGALLAACDGGGAVRIAATATFTPTPLSTPLPTVATQVPFGAETRPYQVVVVPPRQSAQTARDLNDFLNAQTGRAFNAVITQSGPEALAALCGETPTFAWVSGLTMVAAQMRGCGQPAILIQRGRGAAASTGVRSELIISPESRVTGIAGFRERDFCRLNAQDAVTWLLPVIVMRRGGNFDPFIDLRNVRDLPDIASIVREVAFNRCVGAIPAGTLADYTVPGIAFVTSAVSVLPDTTTPELPYGGLVISERVPQPVAEQVVRLFLNNPDALEGLIEADGLVEVDADRLSAITRLLQEAGIAPPGQ